MAEYPPTPEQQIALDLARTGGSMKIEALAGSGKTSTLVLIAEMFQAEKPRAQLQYVVFNRKMSDEAKGMFPGNVKVNTAHSLAYGALGHKFQARIDGRKRMKSYEIGAILGLDPLNVQTFTNETKRLSPSFLAGVVMKAVGKFCQTADAEITERHFGIIPNLDPPKTAEKPATYTVNNMVAAVLLPAAKRAWKDIQRYDGALPFTQDYYLKMWQLSKPVLWADVILFDEAQDANPVMQAVIEAQAAEGRVYVTRAGKQIPRKPAQIIWVGDSYQQIYTFTGAVNALAKVTTEHTAYLTQSFRFGPEIAAAANAVLAHLGATVTLRGFEKIKSTVGPIAEPKAILTRTNAAAVRAVLNAIEQGLRPALVGGGKDIVRFALGARDLMDTGSTDFPELACFGSWAEVVTYVDEDEQGADLQLMVKLIDEFGVQTILDAINGCEKEDAPGVDVVVSTAHKSKGCQWGTVRLASDFPDDIDKIDDEGLRLLYVSVTRAQFEIDIDGCAILMLLCEGLTAPQGDREEVLS